MMTIEQSETRLLNLLRGGFPNHRIVPELWPASKVRTGEVARLPEIRLLFLGIPEQGVIQWRVEIWTPRWGGAEERRHQEDGVIASIQKLNDLKDPSLWRREKAWHDERIERFHVWNEIWSESFPIGEVPTLLLLGDLDPIALELGSTVDSDGMGLSSDSEGFVVGAELFAETTEKRLEHLGKVTSVKDNEVRWQDALVGSPTGFFQAANAVVIYHPYGLIWETNDGHLASSTTLSGQWCVHEKAAMTIMVELSFPFLPEAQVEAIRALGNPCFLFCHDRPVLSVITERGESKVAIPVKEPIPFLQRFKGIPYGELIASFQLGGVP